MYFDTIWCHRLVFTESDVIVASHFGEMVLQKMRYPYLNEENLPFSQYLEFLAHFVVLVSITFGQFWWFSKVLGNPEVQHYATKMSAIWQS